MANAYNDFRVTLAPRPTAKVATARGKGAVASVSGPASDLAIAVLRDGGNAFDAAFSLAFSLCVYHPQAGNIGGGGYLVFQEKGSLPKAINYREQAPQNARRAAYLLPDGSPDPDKTAYGPTSVCTPGTVKAFFALQQRYGKLRARDLLTEIAKHAEAGAPLTQYEADCLNRLGPKLAASPEAKRIYVRPEPFKRGDVLVNRALARTFSELAREGERAFYHGRIAEQIVSDVKAHGGFISAADLADYTWREVAPISIEIKGKRLWTVPPEGGGALLIEMLGLLDREEFYRCAPGTPDYYHLLAQAAKVAFIDRLDYLGDLPVEQNAVYRGIFDKATAARLFALVCGATPTNTSTDVAAGLIRAARQTPIEAPTHHVSGTQTTHFSVIDAEGNAVSSSYTMNLRYGSKWCVEGAGFLLNGSMDSFSFLPGRENYFGVMGSEANLFAPRKRPASNMAPVLVTSSNGAVDVVLGTPGGPTIPTALASVLIPTLVHGLSPEAVIQEGRLHHQGWPDVLYHEPGTVAPELLAALADRGYVIKDKGEPIGDMHGVFRSGNEYLAVSDYRREGRCAAY